MVPNTSSAVVSSPSRVSARHLPFGAWADRFSHVRSISAFTRVLNRTSCLSDRGLLVALVHEDQGDGREQDEGGDVEGAREACYADEEAEGEGADAGPGVEGDVPQGAAEAAFVVGDPVHDEDERRVLKQADPGAEEERPDERRGPALREGDHAARGGHQAGAPQKGRGAAARAAGGRPCRAGRPRGRGRAEGAGRGGRRSGRPTGG